jgi:hypothetical protein
MTPFMHSNLAQMSVASIITSNKFDKSPFVFNHHVTNIDILSFQGESIPFDITPLIPHQVQSYHMLPSSHKHGLPDSHGLMEAVTCPAMSIVDSKRRTPNPNHTLFPTVTAKCHSLTQSYNQSILTSQDNSVTRICNAPLPCSTSPPLPQQKSTQTSITEWTQHRPFHPGIKSSDSNSLSTHQPSHPKTVYTDHLTPYSTALSCIDHTKILHVCMVNPQYSFQLCGDNTDL